VQVALDSLAGREFLLCDFNRDADSYRSPWSNSYFPPLEDGTTPPEALRVRTPHLVSLTRRSLFSATQTTRDTPQALELQANELFGSYREQYYDGGLSSVYLWPHARPDDDDNTHGSAPPPEPGSPGAPFAGCFLVHKDTSEGGQAEGEEEAGRWDAVHVVAVMPSASGGTTSYQLSTTVAVRLTARSGVASPDAGDGSAAGGPPAAAVRHSGRVTLAGSLGRSATSTAPTPATCAGHLVALGRMIEEMENKLRAGMDSVYFGKTAEVVAHLRKAETQELGVDRRESKQAAVIAQSLRGGVGMAMPGAPPPGGIALPGMMGMGAGFDPKAALANLRSTKKAAPPPEAE
jgi:capping protein beta